MIRKSRFRPISVITSNAAKASDGAIIIHFSPGISRIKTHSFREVDAEEQHAEPECNDGQVIIDIHEDKDRPAPIARIAEEALNESEDAEDVPGIRIARFCRNYPQPDQQTERRKDGLQSENDQPEGQYQLAAADLRIERKL